MLVLSCSNYLLLLLQERGPFQGLKVGCQSHIGKRSVQGDRPTDKARDFIGKQCWGGELESKGNQKDSSAMLVVTGFTVMGLVLGCLWSVILTQGPS